MSRATKTIILISGKKRAGKDYLASQLKAMLPFSEVMAFADPMKSFTAGVLGISESELEINKNLEAPILWYSNSLGSYTFRNTLQNVGTQMKSLFGGDVWAKLMLDRINKSESNVIIVSDWRFNIEDSTLSDAGLYLVTVRVDNKNCAKDGHSSEIELDSRDDFSYRFDNTNHFSLDSHLDQIIDLICYDGR